jgi:hypothetical protein
MVLRKLLALLAATSLASFLAIPALAQNYRAQVRGLVTDQTGALLPGANVTLLNVKTGISATKQSDSAGLYIFDFVDPGTYTVGVETAGFGKFLQENVSVQSGGDVTVNATLNPGTLLQTVPLRPRLQLSSLTPPIRN